MSKEVDFVLQGLETENIITVSHKDKTYEFFETGFDKPFAVMQENSGSVDFFGANTSEENREITDSAYQRLLVLSKYRTF